MQGGVDTELTVPNQLSGLETVELNGEHKAIMLRRLLVMAYAGRSSRPVPNAGSLHAEAQPDRWGG